MGRKILLSPKYHGSGSAIIDFEEKTLFEEGQFINDKLDGTFGRRIYFNGKIEFGWFMGQDSKLHGYGKDTANISGGLFEYGTFIPNNNDVKYYDPEIDLIA